MDMVVQDAPEVRTAMEGRFDGDAGRSLRSRTARGTVINSAFLVATNALTLVQGVVIAGLIAPAVYGQWGLLMAAFITLLTLAGVGIEDRYIQQDDLDQRHAFEIAFTLQALLGLALFAGLVIGMPAFALLYGHDELILPGLTFAVAVPALVLQMPLWAHYRRMDFVRQRSLQAIDPVVTLLVTVTLAAIGLGVWALVIGAITGTWVAALAIVRSSPYPLRFRWDRVAFREYRTYSLPLFLGAITAALLIQAPTIVGARVAGIAAVAAITLANNIAQFTGRVDGVVTNTLYPAICAVKDRPDLLFEAFWKSNRIALLWAAPLGVAAALFAGDFVHLVIGDRWHYAVPLIGIYGVTAALNQIGFNWTAFFRAIGDTRPIAVNGVVGLIGVILVAVPLLAASGVTAFGLALGGLTLVSLTLRVWYLRRLFPALAIIRHSVLGIAPTVPALLGILALRTIDHGERGAAHVAAEATLYALMVVIGTAWSQRALLRESVGYVRRRGSA